MSNPRTWIVAIYKFGESLYWTGGIWTPCRTLALAYNDRREAEAFAIRVQGPWEAVVVEN